MCKNRFVSFWFFESISILFSIRNKLIGLGSNKCGKKRDDFKSRWVNEKTKIQLQLKFIKFIERVMRWDENSTMQSNWLTGKKFKLKKRIKFLKSE